MYAIHNNLNFSGENMRDTFIRAREELFNLAPSLRDFTLGCMVGTAIGVGMSFIFPGSGMGTAGIAAGVLNVARERNEILNKEKTLLTAFNAGFFGALVVAGVAVASSGCVSEPSPEINILPNTTVDSSADFIIGSGDHIIFGSDAKGGSITVGPDSFVGAESHFETQDHGEIIVGPDAIIEEKCEIKAYNGGDIFVKDAYVGENSKLSASYGAMTLGDHVVLGPEAHISGKVHLEDVAAGSRMHIAATEQLDMKNCKVGDDFKVDVSWLSNSSKIVSSTFGNGNTVSTNADLYNVSSGNDVNIGEGAVLRDCILKDGAVLGPNIRATGVTFESPSAPRPS